MRARFYFYYKAVLLFAAGAGLNACAVNEPYEPETRPVKLEMSTVLATDTITMPVEALSAAAAGDPDDDNGNDNDGELQKDIAVYSFTAENMPAEQDETREESGPLELTVEQAVLSALGQNRSLAVETLSPVVAGTFIETERAAFDPVLAAQGSLTRETSRSLNNNTGRFFSVDGNSYTAETSVETLFPTGTEISVTLEQSGSDTDRSIGTERTRAGLNLTQALLRGGRTDANLAALRQAEVGAMASVYNLRGFAESLVASVETAYWDYALARRQLEIFKESRDLSQRQLEETRSRIGVGQMAETEESVANAELALRRQQLIDAENAAESARLQLLRLLNMPSADGWDREIILKDNAVVPEVALGEPAEHEALALKLRPELNEARLQAMQGELETVQTRNGLLPRLDLFANLGRTGYARSVSGSMRDLDGDGYDFTMGLNYEFPYRNRAARAADRRARASYRQALESVGNLEQLVALDVRTAILEVERSLQQIEASAARRVLQEEVLRAETARFNVGSSTALDVARVQRDLLESRISEVEAVVNYRKALIDLYHLDGSLLLRRGIAGPGDEEVILH